MHAIVARRPSTLPGLLALALLAGAPQDDPAPALEHALRAPEGLEVRVWARTPLLRNPTSIDADERGRLWVSEGVNYRRFNTKKDGPPAQPEGDRIVILEDVDGDGRADSSKVFVQDPDLVAPLGLAVLGDKVVVACSPALLVYTRDAQDRVVRKEKLLGGWGGLDHDHGLHRFAAGPDGRWYGNAGNAGPHVVTDRSGWTLRAGSWYTGGTPHNRENTPGLKSDDGRVYTGGVMVRVEPDGSRLSVLGHGFRNPYGTCPDSFGDVWMNDNDDTQSCRTTWLMRHGDCGYNSKDGTRSWQADRMPWQPVTVAHWRQEDPGVIPSGHVYGNGAPTGIAYYENGALGAAFDGGLLLSCEAGQNVVWGYRRTPEGAGFRLSAFPFLTSTGVQDPNYVWHKKTSDPRLWFRPSGIAVGGDGAVYVADWFDPVVGGHLTQDREAQGTIYRVAPKGAAPRTPAVDASTVEGQIELLKSPAPGLRYQGYLALAAGGRRSEAALRALLSHPNRFFRARAVWVLARIGADVDPLLSDPDPELRITALRALEQCAPARIPELAGRLAADASPAVRRELALALRDLPAPRRLELLGVLAAAYPAGDRWYLEALGSGAEGIEAGLYDALLARSPGPPSSWTPAFADIAWRLHPAAAVPAFLERALDAALPAAARSQAIDALAFIQEKAAALAVREIAERGPEDLRTRAASWLSHRAGREWKAHGVRIENRIGAVLLPGAPRFSSPALTKGAVDFEIDLRGAKRLYLAARRTGGGSRDGADWLNPRLLGTDPGGRAREVPLSGLKCISAEGPVRAGLNSQGLPLRVSGVVHPDGLGTCADSVLVYDVSGFDTLKGRAGVDDGAGSAGIRFLVHHDGPSEGERAASLRRTLLDAAQPAAARRDAASALARSPEGGAILVSLALDKKLPPEYASQAAEDLRRNPDLTVRALASRAFVRTTSAGRPLPPIEELAALEGDAAEGRRVFLSPAAACASCHRAGDEGRDVGPDLSRIGEKFDRRGLLDAILNPSAAILVGYEAHLFELENGETLTGFVSGEDGASVTVRVVEGPPKILSKKSISRRRQLDLSLMPDNAALGLEPRQLAGLATFLQGLRKK